MNGLIRKLHRRYPVFCSLLLILTSFHVLSQDLQHPFELSTTGTEEEADSLFGIREFQSSLELYESIILDPEIRHYPSKYFELKKKYAWNLIALGQFRKTVSFSKSMLAENPSNKIKSSLYHYLGISFQHLLSYDSAIHYYLKSSESKKRSPNHFLLSQCYLGLGEFEAAKDFFDLGVFTRPHQYRSHLYSLATLELARNKLFESDSILTDITSSFEDRTHPNNQFSINIANLMKVGVQVSMDDLESAWNTIIKVQRDIRETDYDSTAYFYFIPYIGDYYRKIGRYEKAISIYRQSIDQATNWLEHRNPFFVGVHNSIANSFISLRKPEEALVSINDAIILNTSGWDKYDILRLPNLKSVYNPYGFLNSIRIRGRIFSELYERPPSQLNDLHSALKNYQLCDTLIDRIMTSFVSSRAFINSDWK